MLAEIAKGQFRPRKGTLFEILNISEKRHWIFGLGRFKKPEVCFVYLKSQEDFSRLEYKASFANG